MTLGDDSPTEVLIVGAGPTGLVLGLWLRRLGISVRIVDQYAEPGMTSRALAVHARTLELYRQLGLAHEVVQRRLPFTAVNLWVRGKLVARAPLGDIGRGLSPFPFIVIYPQDQHEKLLIERLRRAGCEVERNTKLIDVEERGHQVVARLETSHGTRTECRALYVAGCDGAHSRVRQVLDIGFPGGTYERVFYVADVELHGKVADQELHVALDEADLIAVFPMKGRDGNCEPFPGASLAWALNGLVVAVLLACDGDWPASAARDHVAKLVLESITAACGAVSCGGLENRGSDARLVGGLDRQHDRSGGEHSSQRGRLVRVLPAARNVPDVDGGEACRQHQVAQRVLIGQRERPWGAWRSRRQQRFERRDVPRCVAVFGLSPRRDNDGAAGTDDPPRLGERVHGVGCVLKRIEPGHEIERLVRVGQILQLALTKVDTGQATARDRQEFRGCIDPRDLYAALFCTDEKASGAATGV